MNHLTEIITTLADRGVEFIVCGGVAAVLQGVERMTLDLDLSVSRKPGNMERFLATMKEMALEPRIPLPPETLLDREKLDLIRAEKGALVFTFIDSKNSFRQVDIFLIEHMQYENLAPGVDTVRIENREVAVLSRHKLLELKQAIHPPRDKDILDIKVLRKLIEKDADI